MFQPFLGVILPNQRFLFSAATAIAVGYLGSVFLRKITGSGLLDGLFPDLTLDGKQASGGKITSGPVALQLLVLTLVAASAYAGYRFGRSEPIPRTLVLQFPAPACEGGTHKLLVFLHGWRGDAENTWQRFPTLACSDPELSDVTVLVLSYPTYIANANLRMGSTASWIADRMDARHFAGFDKVAIVAHSIGGLVARRMLLQRGSVAQHVGLLVEMATPHTGAADYAQAIQLTRFIGMEGGDIVAEVARDSEFLRNLQADWNALQPRPVSECYSSPQDWLVSRESAIFQCGQFHYLPAADHRELVKPANRDDDRYVVPMGHVKRYFGSVAASLANPESQIPNPESRIPNPESLRRESGGELLDVREPLD